MYIKFLPITLVSVNVAWNTKDYPQPFLEMILTFVDENGDLPLHFSLSQTEYVDSEIDTVQNIMLELFECQRPENMIGQIIEKVSFRNNSCHDWIVGGIGSHSSDKFINLLGDGNLVTVAELKEELHHVIN